MTRPAIMTGAIATFDWAATPLGAKGLWPAELRTTVVLCLGADYPTAVFWGDEWRFFCNDASSATLKRDTPVLGQPAANVWGKWWAPMAEAFAQIVATVSGTNAAKNGALSDKKGHIDLDWKTTRDGFNLEWHEPGGPPVFEPRKRGFGMRMIECVLTSDLTRKVDVTFATSGVRCRIVAIGKGNIA